MQFDKVFTVKKEHSKDEFLRRVLIELAGSGETPVDVVKASFGDVEERIREVLVCSAHVESDYSASVGYDRIEEYWDKEKKTKYVDGKRYEYYEDVKKTRTVTDWQPHSGHTSGDSTKATFNDEENNNREIDSLMIKAITSAKDDSIIEKGEADINSSSLSLAKKMCAWDIEFSVRFPGDHHKDERYNSNVDVQEVECYKLPFYEVTFTYGGKKYHACGFACGNVDVYTELPPNDVDIVAQANNDTKGSKNAMIFGWVAFAVLFVFACAMIAAKVYWTWAFPLVMLVIAIVLHVKSDKAYKERLRSLKEDNVTLKKKELDAVLTKYGYDRVTSDENSLFDSEAKSRSYASSHERRGPKTAAIWCSIATVILIIVSLVCGSNNKSANLHSPDQFTFAVTQKSQEYKSNVSPYTNGCYYIYLTYQISADEIGADYMNLKVYVYKNGTELGYITSSLSNMNLDAGATKTYTVNLSDNQPEKNNNTFFIAMYNANASELTYKFEVESINFSDGKYYYNR